MTAASWVRAWLGRDVNALLLGGALALAVWPFLFGDPYALRLLTLAGIYAIAAIGWQFVFGHAGALSLAQGTFFGIGAYVAGILSLRAGLGFELTLPAAMLAAGMLAALVALPVLRLESHYFALATLGVGQVVLLLAVNWESVTGGANGLAGVPALTLFGDVLGRGWPLLLLVWGLVAVAALIARRVTGGLAGARLRLMREQPMAATAVGVDTRRQRLHALLLSAVFAAAAGALQVHTVRVVSPEVLEFHVMVALLAITVIGGRTSVAGAILGAVLLVHLPEWFRPLEKYYLLAYGAALMVTIVAAPWGIMGTVRALRRRLVPEAPPPLPTARQVSGVCPAGTLEIRGLVRHFGGVRAVDGIDLDIPPGQAVGIVGANGSGKSTLVNLVAGAERPTAGTIRWAGENLAGLPPHRVARAGVARTFQSLALVDGMNVLDNVAAAAPPGTSLAQARAEAAGLLRRLGVEDGVWWRDCGELPPGLRRRVEVARALLGRPACLLLDEPAAGLAGDERRVLADALRGLAATGMTLVVVEHDLDFLLQLVDRLVCLDGGTVIADGAPGDVREDPAVIAAWLGAAADGEAGDG